MAWTDAERDALRSAIASGVETITFNDRSVTYQGLTEMRELLAEMERSLATSTRTFRVAAFDKGV